MADERYLRLLREMEDLHRAKAAGYSGQENPDTWSNFREAEQWGLTPLQGCLVRMGDKYRRVQSLTRNAANEQVGESRRDTLMDLAAYALIAICLEEEEDERGQRSGRPELRVPEVPGLDGNGTLPGGDGEGRTRGAAAEAWTASPDIHLTPG